MSERLTADEHWQLRLALGHNSMACLDWPCVTCGNTIAAVEALLDARLTEQAARLAEQSETIVALREGYREAVGVPPSEHQSRRLEAMATRIEELLAENARLRVERNGARG